MNRLNPHRGLSDPPHLNVRHLHSTSRSTTNIMRISVFALSLLVFADADDHDEEHHGLEEPAEQREGTTYLARYQATAF